MVCLDTSFLIDVLEANEDARELMGELDGEREHLSVTPVTASELWIGGHLGSRAEYEATRELLQSLTWLNFSRDCARRAGDLQADLIRKGGELGVADCMIAAISLEHDERLVTGDSDFERVPNLRVQTYK
ncbi:PIN domain-containing protein [Halalkalicoccus sp. NIPERK01]|uniref:PIN domain-containing protein n=1 Tax=Halalkalicoccus sp. NIPERK01 TaxID=3053469 RepID=UPI00256EC155|nr:PIN domain-containing protein [Halalkalicoccus sp. NIPERK01]MDL5362654.1 PIN domain-containing protein [Halalkalicoccus sp. NIPERK01]